MIAVTIEGGDNQSAIKFTLRGSYRRLALHSTIEIEKGRGTKPAEPSETSRRIIFVRIKFAVRRGSHMTSMRHQRVAIATMQLMSFAGARGS